MDKSSLFYTVGYIPVMSTLFHTDLGIYFNPSTYHATEDHLGGLSTFLNVASETNISFVAITVDGTAGEWKLLYWPTNRTSVLCCLIF